MPMFEMLVEIEAGMSRHDDGRLKDDTSLGHFQDDLGDGVGFPGDDPPPGFSHHSVSSPIIQLGLAVKFQPIWVNQPSNP